MCDTEQCQTTRSSKEGSTHYEELKMSTSSKSMEVLKFVTNTVFHRKLEEKTPIHIFPAKYSKKDPSFMLD